MSELYPGQAYIWEHNKNIRRAEEAAMTAVATQMSFLEKLTQTVYLDYVLKVLGIVLFGLALLKGWHSLGFFNKALLVSGPIAWYVGARFTKIYR